MTNHSQITKVEVFAAIIACTLLTVPFADAKPGSRGGKDRPTAQFERLDTNEDGVLSIDELTAPALERAEAMFLRKDQDEDGLLTFEEATSGREPRDLSDIADEIVQCVADLQAETGNENIVVPEASKFASPQEKFNAKDTDLSGDLDLTEVLQSSTENVTSIFDNMDTDNSEDVTLEEFTAHKVSAKATRRAIRSCVDELTSEEI